ncbi:MAG: hypothetical protein O7F71_21020 [Gammaproteobacteria bacterium]|nr:hypothetical protein [Gammaproteobacteria bacterium]
MPIPPKISHKIEDGILVVTVEGWIKMLEMAAYASDHIVEWASNPCLLWDFRTTIFFDFTSEVLTNISDTFAQASRVRAGWRTALVVRKEESLLGDLVVELTKSHNVPVEHQVFLSMGEARSWLVEFSPESVVN